MIAFGALLVSGAAFAQTGMLVPTSTGRPDPAVLSLREMAIDVGLARGYARVNVRQVFENHTAAIQEGTWRFRLPESGAVGDFAVWDGNVRIPGVILEKRRARSIYRALTTQRIDPGLLQQGEEEDREPGASGHAAERPSGGALFSVKVAPIPGYGTKRLEMQYQHEVPWVDGVAEFRIALRPPDGEPMVAGALDVNVTVADGAFDEAVPGALPLAGGGLDAPSSSASPKALYLSRGFRADGRPAISLRTARFHGENVRLETDVVVRYRRATAEPLELSTYRNPAGGLPDGLALAPWERVSELPPEKDGFFLLELAPKGSAPERAENHESAPARRPLAVAFVFDTSLSQRFASLEISYRTLVRLLDALTPEDRFALVPFDRTPAPEPLHTATPDARRAALETLRSRPLAPGTDVAAAVAAARALVAPAGEDARIVLLTDGAGGPRAAEDGPGASARQGPSGDLRGARGSVPLYTVLTGEERRESYTVASEAVLGASGGSGDTADERLFARRLLAPPPPPAPPNAKKSTKPAMPFTIDGGDPQVHDVYAVMTQPPAAGSLSGWVGRYASPTTATTVSLAREGETYRVTAPFPATDLTPRDLPRRWARARVDDLLRRIELEGEKREWVDEILALSRRYKFVTPYTAFLAAPRSLLRPRRIQPGDPVIRVEADPGIVAVTALLPFGERLALSRRPGTALWHGRFLVPETLKDGPLPIRLVLKDSSGRTLVETKRLVVDGTPPTITPDVTAPARAGAPYRVFARADADAVFLSVRLGDGPPVPLRWDGASRKSVADLFVPDGTARRSELFFEASDAAGNHGFARAALEVR
jgi:Ca-activated chloride channel family protein